MPAESHWCVRCCTDPAGCKVSYIQSLADWEALPGLQAGLRNTVDPSGKLRDQRCLSWDRSQGSGECISSLMQG